MRALPRILLLAAAALQTAPPAGWPRVEALFHERVRQAGIVGASLMVVKDGRIAGRRSSVSFNMNSQSKTDPRTTTRSVDNDLRDAFIRELLLAR